MTIQKPTTLMWKITVLILSVLLSVTTFLLKGWADNVNNGLALMRENTTAVHELRATRDDDRERLKELLEDVKEIHALLLDMHRGTRYNRTGGSK
jgi:hypothetical protein